MKLLHLYPFDIWLLCEIGNFYSIQIGAMFILSHTSVRIIIIIIIIIIIGSKSIK